MHNTASFGFPLDLIFATAYHASTSIMCRPSIIRKGLFSHEANSVSQEAMYSVSNETTISLASDSSRCSPITQEVSAAPTISQRGVLLVGTAHGIALQDLMQNPELRPLVGGVTPVTLGDAEAMRSNRGSKVGLLFANRASMQ
jgi:hypothetical protein